MSEPENDQDKPVGLPDADQPSASESQETQDGEQAESTAPPKKFWNRKRVDQRTYDLIYQAWKPGQKSAKQLGREFGISDDSILRFISKGVTSMGWPSYRQRLHLERSSIQAATDKAAEKIAEEIVGEAREIRKRNLSIAKAGSAVLGHMVGRIMKNLEATPMTRSIARTTNVVEADGTKKTIRETVQRPMDLYEVGQVMQKISSGLTQLSRVELAVLGIQDPDDPMAGVPDAEKLTQAEVDYINEHEGQLPEGMTVEEFIRRGGMSYGLVMSSAAKKSEGQ